MRIYKFQRLMKSRILLMLIHFPLFILKYIWISPFMSCILSIFFLIFSSTFFFLYLFHLLNLFIHEINFFVGILNHFEIKSMSFLSSKIIFCITSMFFSILFIWLLLKLVLIINISMSSNTLLVHPKLYVLGIF